MAKIYNNIDLEKRKIEFDDTYKQVVVDDHNIVIPFRIDNEFSGFNVKDMMIMVNYQNPLGEKNTYLVDSTKIEDLGKRFEFYWVMDQRATVGVEDREEGILEVTISFHTMDENGNLTEQFSTKMAGIRVLPLVDTEGYIQEEKPYADILGQILSGNIPGGGGSGTPGKDGFSPVAKVVQTTTGATITITDKTGTTTAVVTNGQDGAKGQDGADGADGFTPIVKAITNGISVEDKAGNVYNITNGADGQDGAKGQDGADGADGQDGFTPIITALPNGISVEDKNGVVYNITNGQDGADGADGAKGADGADGQDGFTPIIKTIANGISVEDKSGNVYNITNGQDGADGADGAKGADGADGQDGADGFTPIITALPNGISVEDKSGNVYNITNGADGAKGADGQDGKDGADGFTPIITSIADGIEIEAQDGTKYTITNGTDGADGIDGYTPIIKSYPAGVEIVDKDGTAHRLYNGFASEQDLSSDTPEAIFEMPPNMHFILPTFTALTIVLRPGTSGRVNYYSFEFVTGATVPTLTFSDSSVKMNDGFEIKANSRVMVNILNGCGVGYCWAL